MGEPKLDAPHGYEILSREGIVVLELSGRVVLASLTEAADRIYADPEYDPSFDAVVDMSEASFDMGFGEMAQYVWRIQRHPRRLRGRVVLVTQKKGAFGFGRMYSSLADGLQSIVHFEPTVHDGLAWLRRTEE